MIIKYGFGSPEKRLTTPRGAAYSEGQDSTSDTDESPAHALSPNNGYPSSKLGKTRRNPPVAQLDTPTTSPQLLGRLLGEDAAAWQTFFERYRPLIQAWCARRLPASEAEEVAAKVWLRLVQAMPTFDYDTKEGRFRDWLRTVVNNAIRNHWRNASHRPRFAADAAALLELWPDQDSIDDLSGELSDRLRADTERMEGIVARVRGRVEDHNWKAFWLVVVDERDKPEVARQFDMTRQALHSACKRILTMLIEEARRVFPADRFPPPAGEER